MNGIVLCEDNYMHKRSIDRRTLLCNDKKSDWINVFINDQWFVFPNKRKREKKRMCELWDIINIETNFKNQYHSSQRISWIHQSMKKLHIGMIYLLQ
jgi:hypothetical protein